MAGKIEFRCEGCGKMLCNTNGDTDIVCPRCGGMNKLHIETQHIVFIPRKMRQRKSSAGVRFE
ncbi:MAG: Com family DNA-binding transcriptional regulator [Eubacteriales bacterium]|nr:Com family DNA-binding transcriptional regulator [Eubacteriales bacterium]